MTASPKPQRIQDRALLDSVKANACVVCGHGECDPCHIRSVGSGGDDSESNLISLCRICHIESHALGWYLFARRYPVAEAELAKRGWEFCQEFGVVKLRRRE